MQRRDLVILLVLALLPVIAYAPAWTEGRLLAPGDGTALHLPLRAAVWQAYARHEWPTWNGAQFCGAPLLAEYRAGALYPPMLLLSLLPAAVAWQWLILFSLSAAGVLTYLYARRLHAGRAGAYVAGLSFALGPFLVGHLGDTPAVVAAPLLPLLLLAAEAYLERFSSLHAAGLAVSVALVLLAGSPEAACAAAVLLAGRLVAAYLFADTRRPPPLRWTMFVVAAGILLSAPQVIPSLVAAGQAGPASAGAASGPASLPGALGLVFRYISHTPAAALALAALPLLVTHAPARFLSAALVLGLVLQCGESPATSGVGPLLFDFALALIAGVALGAQWRARRTERGRRLRVYFLFFSLAAAAALSVSATILGPLPATLTSPVGILAFALILYFPLAGHRRPLIAGIWLLPLTVSFLMQPEARDAWRDAPTRREIEQGSPTRAALDHLMALRRGDRMLTLVSVPPGDAALDLGFAGIGALSGHTSVNGYAPLVPWRTRLGLGGMTEDGLLPAAFYETDPALVDVWGARWIQVPSSALIASGTEPPRFEVSLLTSRRRLFPLPIVAVTEIRLLSALANGVDVAQGAAVARLTVRLASGRGEFTFPIRAGIETAEWAYDRDDVRARVRHARPSAMQSWRPTNASFEGHRYLSSFPLPGRYSVDAVIVEATDPTSDVTITQLGLVDARMGTEHFATAAAAYLSDAGRFREAASTPTVHLFERSSSLGGAWVVPKLARLPAESDVRTRLLTLTRSGIDPYREALVEADDTRDASPVLGASPAPSDGRLTRKAEVVGRSVGRIAVRAEGPGYLIVSESWDRGWMARRDGAAAPILRVDQMAMAISLPAGTHEISLRFWPPGLTLGLLAAAAALIGLLLVPRLRTRI
jgi:hypothetical protein